MGNGIGKVCLCASGAGDMSHRYDNVTFLSNQYDKSLGNSVCYIRPDQYHFSNCSDMLSVDDGTQMTFRSISGASVSANSSTPPSTCLADSLQPRFILDSAASFESSSSFTSMPLQHIPHRSSVGGSDTVSGLMERRFCSGPVVGDLPSSPFDRGLNPSSIEKSSEPVKLQRSLSHNGYGISIKPSKPSLNKIFRRAISSTISRGRRSIVEPIKGMVSVRGSISEKNKENGNATVSNISANLSLHEVEDDNYHDDGCGGGSDALIGNQNLHWAQGRAGEDRVHIVVSEDHGWVFVGIYDGFNGPDATDYLLNNLFYAVYNELKEILCNSNSESKATSAMAKSSFSADVNSSQLEEEMLRSLDGNNNLRMGNGIIYGCSSSFNKENNPIGIEKLGFDSLLKRTEGMNDGNSRKRKKWKGKEIKCKSEWDSKKVGLENKVKKNLNFTKSKSAAAISHSEVLQALSEALRKTEDTFLKTADEMITKNPVLAMMGSCVLVMLMQGDDVYLMNVGDSRAILAQTAEYDIGLGKNYQELNGYNLNTSSCLNSLQLTTDHSPYVKEEVQRIRREHPNDPSAVIKGRVKGFLNVTRAFGAGFLKQPKYNNAVLESFRVNYIGDSPYVTCSPSLHHYRLSPGDKFLMLSSDGLYQYFTNEEAVAKVESFINLFPDRDPAQLLIEEILYRAAQKAGMDFHELLEIPQGERRLYHDDISIVIISLEGKIWRSSE